MGINPNASFTRTVFDLSTPVAVKLDEVVKASGKSKKQWLTDTITAAVEAASKSKTKR